MCKTERHLVVKLQIGYPFSQLPLPSMKEITTHMTVQHCGLYEKGPATSVDITSSSQSNKKTYSRHILQMDPPKSNTLDLYGIIEVIKIHHWRDMNVSTKFQGNPSKSCRDISCKPTDLNLMMASQRITRSRVHSLGTMNVCTLFYTHLSMRF